MPRAKLFNKEDVLHKAMNLFWQKGYYATSMQDLVTHLGINRASLYSTFGGKKSLFDKSLTLYCLKNKATTLAFLKEQASVKAGIKKLFEIQILEATSDTSKKGCFVVNSTTEMGSTDDDVQAIITTNKNDFETIFYQFLLTGQKSGEISKEKDIKAIATLIYTLFSGVNVIAKADPNQQQLFSSVDLVLSLLS